MKKLTLIFAITIFLFISCNHQQKINFKTSPQGIEYHFVEKNDKAPQPVIKGGAVINVKAYWKDSLIFDSREVSPDFSVMIKDQYQGSIDQALLMMHQGDSAIFKLDAIEFLTKTANTKVPDYIKQGDKLTFYVRLKKVLSPKEVEEEHQKFLEYRRNLEPKLIEDYINRHEEENFKELENGLYVEVKEQGDGLQPFPGDSVYINYIGYFINGEEFANTVKRGKLFAFKMGDQTVIPGLEIAVGMLKEGGISTVIIPSYLAYGEEGLLNLIPPYSALVFKVQLVKVKRAQIQRM